MTSKELRKLEAERAAERKKRETEKPKKTRVVKFADAEPFGGRAHDMTIQEFRETTGQRIFEEPRT